MCSSKRKPALLALSCHVWTAPGSPAAYLRCFGPALQSAPVAPAGADDNDEQAERQVDSDYLADTAEVGARARPILGVDGAFERQPRPVEQPDEQRDHRPKK